MPTTATLTMSTDALDVVCRALADRGEDYGWSVYRRGGEIPAADRGWIIADDDSASAWLEAWDVASKSYHLQTGSRWNY